jgi:hypothetical protein
LKFDLRCGVTTALLMLLAALGQGGNPPEHPTNDPALACGGGAMVFFTPGSSAVAGRTHDRLLGFIEFKRRANLRGRIAVEAGGDGVGSAFNEALSRRRAEALRGWLIAHGVEPQRIETYLPADRMDPRAEEYQFVLGWVAQFVPASEIRRQHGNVVIECF